MSGTESKQIMAENIKRFMAKKGVTNQQLCDALDFKYTTFMDWIKGVTYPRIGKVEAMAEYFGCEKSDLIERKTEAQIEMQKKNDTLSDIVVKLRMDDELLSIVESLCNLEKDKLAVVQQVISAFQK